jgi:predicted TIM-barrel fold metal-dependent hydrolase
METDGARWIETAPISENDRRKICYDNAAALFGLGR